MRPKKAMIHAIVALEAAATVAAGRYAAVAGAGAAMMCSLLFEESLSRALHAPDSTAALPLILGCGALGCALNAHARSAARRRAMQS